MPARGRKLLPPAILLARAAAARRAQREASPGSYTAEWAKDQRRMLLTLARKSLEETKGR